MTLRNLTPHPLVVVDPDGAVRLSLPACPTPPRVEQVVDAEDTLEPGVVVRHLRYAAVNGLPDPIDGVLLVVSRVVARETPRVDLVFPDVEVRDPDGRIVACRYLARFSRHPTGLS